jgi:hypothetical protein
MVKEIVDGREISFIDSTFVFTNSGEEFQTTGLEITDLRSAVRKPTFGFKSKSRFSYSSARFSNLAVSSKE